MDTNIQEAELQHLYQLVQEQEESMGILFSNYEHLKERVKEIEMFLHRNTKKSHCC